MVRMFVRHRVHDYAAWKAAYDDFDTARKGLGVVGDAVFQAADDPNDITAWHDFETLEAAQAFASETRLEEAMDAAGVRGEPAVWFTSPA